MADVVDTMESESGLAKNDAGKETETVNECSSENNVDIEVKEQATKVRDESVDPFKKPAVFAAPSVVGKKSTSVKKTTTESCNGNISKEKATTEESGSQSDSSDVRETQDSSNDSVSPPDKAVKAEKTAVRERVSHAKLDQSKAPPVGKFPPLPYTEPGWGGVATTVPYSFELLKNGAILNTVPLTHQSYFVVGRLPICDVSLEHPSISRYHAVVQYRGQAGEDGLVGEETGFYVYDLGSTHGTFVNKNKIPPKTYIRVRVGHVLKFGGSTRLFILQGPESDEETESELTVTELKAQARKQREKLEKRMMGDGSDDDDDDEEEKEKNGEKKVSETTSSEDTGCTWGMGEEVFPEEDENEENPFAMEFQEDQEAAYLKDPKKALQGFYDREGEELEFEYEDKGRGSWLCRIKLPVDDALGRPLVAEATHTGKKKEAAVHCCLEACRMLEARGLLRQEAVSRKRKKKNWEDDDYYDSDDDSFLDRTGTVERKRKERMKKAGKIQEQPDTYDSLVAKLAKVEKELTDTEKKLGSSDGGGSSSVTEDPLDAFMTAVRSQAALDGVERKKLHLHVAELRKEGQRLRKLIELTRPTQLPSLQSGSASQSSEADKPKKLTLPLFGAMKGGSRFKLKTGTIGKLPPKRSNLPAELFNMKELPPGGEEEEEEEEQEGEEGKQSEVDRESEDEIGMDTSHENTEPDQEDRTVVKSVDPESEDSCPSPKEMEPTETPPVKKSSSHKQERLESVQTKEDSSSPHKGEQKQPKEKKTARKMIGPSRPPRTASKQYPEDDPDYCVWVPPAGQTGDGRTHLNEKYGY